MTGSITALRTTLCAATTLSAVALGAAPAAAQSATQSDLQPQVMLIMDSSGSMRRAISGEEKMAIAKRSVADFLAGAPSDVPLGLMAYGHRRAKDCSDIEIVIPPRAGSGTAIRQAVDAMRPRGETPIAESLRRAAAYMKSESQPTTIVLVTDGEEACNADPCAAARELESAGVEFTAHVIGFGLNEEQSRAVKCLADETGGQFIAANDAPQLAAALKRVVPVEPEPVPEPVQKVIWMDDFDGETLSEEWTVGEKDESRYVLDGGELVTFSNSTDRLNGFRVDLPLPRGDWDIQVKARLELLAHDSMFSFGILDEKNNGVVAGVFTQQSTCNNLKGTLQVVELKDGDINARSAKKYVTVKNSRDCSRKEHGYRPFSKAAKKWAEVPTIITLSKRGRKYSASVDGGPYGEKAQTSTLTILRLPKTFRMRAQKLRKGDNEVVANIDWVKLTRID